MNERQAGGRVFYSVYFRFDLFAPSHPFPQAPVKKDPD